MGGTHLTPPNILHNQWKIVDNCTKHALHMQTAHPNSRERRGRKRYRACGRDSPATDVLLLFFSCVADQLASSPRQASAGAMRGHLSSPISPTWRLSVDPSALGWRQNDDEYPPWEPTSIPRVGWLGR